LNLVARSRIVSLCFALSGFTALIYQTGWTREFAFVFGTSDLAVATVLAAYMGGLAAGAAAAARGSLLIRRPLVAYGFLELGIGVSALLVPVALRLATPLYQRLFSSAEMAESVGLASALFYVVCSFLILSVPTALMGATLPLLVHDGVRRDEELGARVGQLYAINTLGAVCGTVVAAFVLLPSLGLRMTVIVAVSMNVAIFLLMAFVTRRSPTPPRSPLATSDAAARSFGAILVLMLASGVLSFTYEVLWTRLLEHVLGASVYAFATMLASFLIGIALGAALAARLASDRERSVRGFALAQLGTALLSLVAFAVVDHLPALALAVARWTGQRRVADSLMAGLTLLPSTVCIGATFPFAVRILARGEADAGPASARVYAWNTIGAVVGALTAGFFLISMLGLEGTLHAAALGNAVLAFGASLLHGVRRRRLALAAALAVVAIATLRLAPPWQLLRSSPLSLTPLTGDVTYYGTGRSATVLLLRENGQWRLTTNGLPEAAIAARGQPIALYRTEHWLTALPVMARPAAKSMLVIGLGGGVAVEAVPDSVRSIQVAELEPQVVAANRSVQQVRERDPLSDPRVRLVWNDARGALLLSRNRFDIIVSQPSHPWTAGASHLYTHEFFELAKDRLSDDGVLLQWIGPAFVDLELLRILVATLSDVFDYVRVYQPNSIGGILLLASRAPLDVERTAPVAIGRSPGIYAGLGLYEAEDVAAALLLDEETARRFGRGAPLNTDHRNYLQMHTLGDRLIPLRLSNLLIERDLVAALPDGVNRMRLIRCLLALGFSRGAETRLAESRDDYEREVGRGLVAESGRRPSAALAAFRLALAQEPGGEEARAGVIRILGARAIEPGALPAAPSRPEERAVLAALQALTGHRTDELRGLEAGLEGVAPPDPLYPPAARLRAAWRIQSQDPVLAREAVRILDGLASASVAGPADWLARAEAGRIADDPVVVLSSLELWLGQGRQQVLASPNRGKAVHLITTVKVPEEWKSWQAGLAHRLEVQEPSAPEPAAEARAP